MWIRSIILIILLRTACALSLNGKISLPAGVNKMKIPHQLNNVHIMLDNRKTYSFYDNSFSFEGVAEGKHFLELYHPHFIFPSYQVTVSQNLVSGASIERNKDGEPLQTFFVQNNKPVTLSAIGSPQYYQKRQGVSILRMAMNPMFLMMAVSLGLMFLMPKMMEGLDPEELKQIQQAQGQSAQQADPQKMLNSFLGVKGGESDSDSD